MRWIGRRLYCRRLQKPFEGPTFRLRDRRGSPSGASYADRLNATTFSPLALAMPRPSVHKLAPPRQRVRSPVSLLGLVADDVGERVLGKLAGEMVWLPAQS